MGGAGYFNNTYINAEKNTDINRLLIKDEGDVAKYYSTPPPAPSPYSGESTSHNFIYL